MKITNEGTYHIITTPVLHYNRWFGQRGMIASTIQLRLEIKSDTEKIHINELSIGSWLEQIIQDKIIASVEFDSPEHLDKLINAFGENIVNDILWVDRNSQEYLVKTVFHIIKTLINEESELISIEII